VQALVSKITETGALTNPVKLDKLLITAARSLTIDKTMNLQDLVLQLKQIDAKNIQFATVPYTGTMQTSAGSSVRLDMVAAETMFAAIRDDTTDAWLAAHPQPEVATFGS
jgi:anionic cell wall polymer biosynthesis LytR-Cps2A-Psr (LCP) family protein